jgi:hypothetical protein
MVLDTTVRGSIIPAVRSAARRGDVAQAEQRVRRYLDQTGSTPEAMEALSWVARGALRARQFSKASDYAKRVHRSVLMRLRDSDLDCGPHLATALGAAIEVLAQAMANRGRRAEAIDFLRRDLARFAATSIRFRLRKNLNLLTMEGQPAPQLENHEWLGQRPPSLRRLRGRPILLFFWAHYCEDSHAQGRVVARVRDRFAERGL